jgi:hypothetical protein
MYDRDVRQYVEKSCKLVSSIRDRYFHTRERPFVFFRCLIKYFGAVYVVLIFSTM